jgi:pyridoxine 5-phosphate synthase
LKPFVAKLQDAGIRVSLFIEPDLAAIEAAGKAGADIVELHTGKYCHLALDNDAAGIAREIDRHAKAAAAAAALGIEVHAGHGLTYNTVAPIARLAEVVELNIGHFLIGEAIFGGLPNAVRRMRTLMDDAREDRARQKPSRRQSA